MKKPTRLTICALLAASLSVPAAAGSLPPQLQLKPGDTGQVFIGVGVVAFRVIEAGEGGWLNVELVPGGGLNVPKPERFWLNVNAALLIQPGTPDH